MEIQGKARRSIPPWSDLPNGLWTTIGNCLSTKADVSRFRAVCRSWRSSLPPFDTHLLFPIRVLINSPNYSAPNANPEKIFTLTESVVYRLAPLTSLNYSSASRGFVMKVQEGVLGKTQLLRPLSRFNPVENKRPNSFPKVLNLLDFRVFELAKVHELLVLDYGLRISYYKVALSLNPSCPQLITIVAGTLYHCKLGAVGDIQICNVLKGTISRVPYEDVICYEEKLYAVAQDGRTVVVDSDLKVTMVACPVCPGFHHKKYLVESFGELLLVDRFKDQFRVSRLNVVEKQWVEMEALGDRILFVGDDCCFSVSSSTQDFPGCKGNCIFYNPCFARDSIQIRKIGVFKFNLDDDGLAYYASCANIFSPPQPWTKPARI